MRSKPWDMEGRLGMGKICGLRLGEEHLVKQNLVRNSDHFKFE